MPITITIPETELYDSEKNEFYYIKESTTISLEHSLLSISKWESKWHKSFFTTFNGTNNATTDEMIDYIKCMTLTKNVDDRIYYGLNTHLVKTIWDYINDPMTATWFSDVNKKTSRETITSELIYYWMIASNIPFEPCQKWHINRLLALIQVCSRKNAPAKKMSQKEIMAQNRALNAQRRMKNHSKG